MNTTSKVITGILVGAATGAILGILFAPDKGDSTRKKISKKSNDITDAIKDGFSKISSTISDKYASAKEDAMSMIEKGKEKASEAKNKYAS